MALAPNRPCKVRGCIKLTREKYCEGHRGAGDAADRARRGNASERGYDGRWQKYREQFLQEFPLCGMKAAGAYTPPGGREMSQCKAAGRTTVATVVHHIRGHKGPADPLFYDARNHEAGCKACHDSETGKAKFGNG